jgi:hypothetical protein
MTDKLSVEHEKQTNFLFIKLLTSTLLIKLLDPEPDPNPNQEQKFRIRIRFRLKKLGSSRIRIRNTGDSSSYVHFYMLIRLLRQIDFFKLNFIAMRNENPRIIPKISSDI